MSPTQFNPRRQTTDSRDQYLRIKKDSHLINKSPPMPSQNSSSSCSSSSTSSSLEQQPQRQRHPVIIHTRSPKVIKTNPRDFMALVQKLTGLSRFNHPKGQNNINHHKKDVSNEYDHAGCRSDVVIGGNRQGTSCFVSTPLTVEPPLVNPNYVTVFTPNSSDFLRFDPMVLNYATDSFLLSSSIPSSTSLEGMNQFCEY